MRGRRIRIVFGLIVLGLIIAVVLVWLILSRSQFQPENLVMLDSVFYRKIDETTLQCRLCALKCSLKEGEVGDCDNIINKSGKLFYVR